MKRLLHEDIYGMSNVRGNRIRVYPGAQPFSFYFSEKTDTHGIRVKPVFNPDKVHISEAGTLKLCDDWEYIPGRNEGHIAEKDIRNMKDFFKKYKVLFAAVWEGESQEGDLVDYFQGALDFDSLVESLECYHKYSEELSECLNVEDLEQVVRQYNIFNMND